MAVNVKVGLIGPLDMLKFKNMAKVREQVIQAAPANEITADYAINNKAKALHPDFQELVVSEVITHEGAGAKTYVMRSKNGGPLAYFRAGQYLSLKLAIDGSSLTRPYSISSSPHDALSGSVSVTVRSNPGGFAAEHMLSEFKVGDEVLSSGPQGNFYYEPLRDPENIVALAGGSGITPFLSMARAIKDGTEDFDLTILFGSRTREQILFREELETLAAECPKIHVVHVLSDEEAEGYEHGFITADLIKKYARAPYSVFVCGPEAMYRFLEGELGKLGLEKKNIRCEMLGVTRKIRDAEGFPAEAAGKTFTITVRQGAYEYTVPASAEEPILVALERSGLTAPSRCRSGECGWCRSKVLDGTYFAAPDNENRRWADIKWNYIHPCVTFPTSDMVIDVPAEYTPGKNAAADTAAGTASTATDAGSTAASTTTDASITTDAGSTAASTMAGTAAGTAATATAASTAAGAGKKGISKTLSSLGEKVGLKKKGEASSKKVSEETLHIIANLVITAASAAALAISIATGIKGKKKH